MGGISWFGLFQGGVVSFVLFLFFFNQIFVYLALLGFYLLFAHFKLVLGKKQFSYSLSIK